MKELEIYTTDTDSGVISVVKRNGKTHSLISQIDVGNAPRGAVKFTNDGRGFVSNCGGDTISEIDTNTHREIARIKVGIAPRGIGIVPGDRFAMVSNSGSNSISIVDLKTRKEVSQIAVGRDPRHMALSKNGKYAYICIWGSHYISIFNIEPLLKGDYLSNDIGEVGRINLKGNVHPYSCAIHPDGKTLYVATTQGESLPVIDLIKEKIEYEIELGTIGSRAITFSQNGEFVFVSIENTSEVLQIAAKEKKIVNRVKVGPGPRGIAFDDNSWTLYASCFSRTTTIELLQKDETINMRNSLTVIEYGNEKNMKINEFDEDGVGVGKGPCSVALLFR